jgi:hypothetical protein
LNFQIIRSFVDNSKAHLNYSRILCFVYSLNLNSIFDEKKFLSYFYKFNTVLRCIYTRRYSSHIVCNFYFNPLQRGLVAAIFYSDDAINFMQFRSAIANHILVLNAREIFQILCPNCEFSFFGLWKRRLTFHNLIFCSFCAFVKIF